MEDLEFVDYEWTLPLPSIDALLRVDLPLFGIDPRNDTDILTSNATSNVLQLRRFSFAVGILALIFFIIGFIPNLLIIFLSLKILSMHNKRETQHLCILSMSIADLIFITVNCPIAFAAYSLRSRMPKNICILLLYTAHLSMVASSLSLLCLNIDKFLALKFPLRYLAHVTFARSKISVLLCWVIAFSWASAFVFTLFNFGENCDVFMHVDAIKVYLGFFVAFFAVPVAISVLISIYVFAISKATREFIRIPTAAEKRLIWRLWKKPTTESIESNKTEAGEAVSEPEKETVRPAASTSFQRFQRRRNYSNFRRAVFVFTETIWSVFTAVPYRVVYLACFYSEEYWVKSILLSSFVLLMLHPVGNPIITFITQPQYQSRIKAVLTKGKLKGDSTPNEAGTQKIVGAALGTHK